MQNLGIRLEFADIPFVAKQKATKPTPGRAAYSAWPSRTAASGVPIRVT
jgi:hypothetical protein